MTNLPFLSKHSSLQASLLLGYAALGLSLIGISLQIIDEDWSAALIQSAVLPFLGLTFFYCVVPVRAYQKQQAFWPAPHKGI